MPHRKIRQIDSSAYINIPKDCLRREGLVDERDDGRDEIQPDHVDVEHLGERSYLIRVPDQDGSVPALEDLEAVQRAAAVQIREHYEHAAAPSAD